MTFEKNDRQKPLRIKDCIGKTVVTAMTESPVILVFQDRTYIRLEAEGAGGYMNDDSPASDWELRQVGLLTDEEYAAAKADDEARQIEREKALLASLIKKHGVSP